MSAYRDKTSWYLGLAAYWFAASAKYFILLLLILPEQVKALTPKGTENTTWGLVLTIGAIWGIFGPAVFGRLSDRLGRRRAPFIAIGAGLTVIALMFLAQANQLWMIFVGYMLLAVSDDTAQGPYQASIPELVPQESRGRASGVMAAFELSAQITIALLGLALGLKVQAVYMAIASITIICAAATLYTLSGTKPITTVSAENAGGGIAEFFSSWARPLRSTDFRWVWFTRFLLSLGFYLVQNYLKYYLDDRVTDHSVFGFKVPDNFAVLGIGLVISLSGALGAVWAARAVDRLGRKLVVRNAGMLMGVLLIPFALVPNYMVILFLAILFGLGYGAYLGSSWALAADILPNAGAIATDMGVWAMSLTVAQMVAGAGGGIIDAFNGMSSGLGYTVIFLLGSFFFFMSTVFVRRIQGST